jgi:hypothetical protein
MQKPENPALIIPEGEFYLEIRIYEILMDEML